MICFFRLDEWKFQLTTDGIDYIYTVLKDDKEFLQHRAKFADREGATEWFYSLYWIDYNRIQNGDEPIGLGDTS